MTPESLAGKQLGTQTPRPGKHRARAGWGSSIFSCRHAGHAATPAARAGSALITAAAVLLGLLAAGLFVVSLTRSTSTSSTPSTRRCPASSRRSAWTRAW